MCSQILRHFQKLKLFKIRINPPIQFKKANLLHSTQAKKPFVKKKKICFTNFCYQIKKHKLRNGTSIDFLWVKKMNKSKLKFQKKNFQKLKIYISNFFKAKLAAKFLGAQLLVLLYLFML